MNKKMREILSQIQEKTAVAETFANTGENAKAAEIMKAVSDLKSEFELQKSIYESQQALAAQMPQEPAAETKTTTPAATFAKGVRDLIAHKAVMTNGTPASAGLTVPQDIQTQINQLTQLTHNLADDVTVENVQAPTGTRVFQKRGHGAKFLTTAEATAVTNEVAGPQFQKLDYATVDRKGFTTVSNDLIADSDANIIQVVTQWLADSQVSTDNAEIVTAIKTNEATDLKDLDGIKKAAIVDLENFVGKIKIFTNAAGVLYLDSLKDTTGRYLLEPDPTEPKQMQLRMGAAVVPVVQLPMDVLPNDTKKVPFIVGSLADGIVKFDRQGGLTISSSTEASIGGVNAFADGVTVLLGTTRADYKVKDATAFVNGYIQVGE